MILIKGCEMMLLVHPGTLKSMMRRRSFYVQLQPVRTATIFVKLNINV